MTCSHCGRTPGDARPPCSHCSHCPPCAATNLPTPCTGFASGGDSAAAHDGSCAGAPHAPNDTAADNAADASTEAVEPEVLQPDDDTTRGTAAGDRVTVHATSRGSGSYRYVSWQQGGSAWGMAASNASCLPMLVTLGLLLGCATQLGLLAAIGFGFFYLLGSVVSTAVKARRILQGQPITPMVIWSNRIIVWAAALFVTVVLAGKM